MLGGMSPETPPHADEIERITSRIRQVDLAKALAARGKVAEALQLLRTVRDMYDEPAKRQLVDWMIRDLERQGAVDGPPSDVASI